VFNVLFLLSEFCEVTIVLKSRACALVSDDPEALMLYCMLLYLKAVTDAVIQ